MQYFIDPYEITVKNLHTITGQQTANSLLQNITNTEHRSLTCQYLRSSDILLHEKF